MRIVMFYHSLISDWNHGNAHFLRGFASELCARGHAVCVYEPVDSWSLRNLLAEPQRGHSAIEAYREAYPSLSSVRYDPLALDLPAILDGADLVLVHEWNSHALVQAIGEQRARGGRFKLLFHDTHHRAVSAPEQLAAYDLQHYDGVLAFGRVLRDAYLQHGWAKRAFVWHEAADPRVFKPLADVPPSADLVWIGNWGDDERSHELHTYLLDPIADLKVSADIYGVRYPAEARAAIDRAGARYRGWLANFEAPQVFAAHRVTVHVPRRYYATALPGIPTIRVFEALACGIPLICAPWEDSEGLFSPGRDYLVARSGDDMRRLLRDVLADAAFARALAQHGLETIRARHTCAHRVQELLGIYDQLEGRSS
jgi:spore maturation protein CgeB